MEAFLLEKLNAKLVNAPVDLNTAAVTGGRVSMKGCNRISLVVLLGASTGATVEFTLQQHNAASSGTSKALSVANRYFHKAGAATSFTEVEPGSAASVYDVSSVFAADGGVLVFEVLAEDLDVNGDFAWISVNSADSGAAKLGAVLAVCSGLDHKPGFSLAL